MIEFMLYGMLGGTTSGSAPAPIYFTLDGHTYKVIADGVRIHTPEIARGEVVRAADGTALSTADGEIRSWSFTLYDLPPDDYHTLRTSITRRRRIIAGGLLIIRADTGVPVTATLDHAQIRRRGIGIRYRPTLTLRTVGPV